MDVIKRVAKLTENVKLTDAKIATFIDNSGSTSGKILDNEIKIARKILGVDNFNNNVVLWNTAAEKPINLKSGGGTKPQCIFKNDYAKDLFEKGEVIIFMTDGQIEQQDVTEFARQTQQFMNKLLYVCIYVSSNINNISELNISVMSSMMMSVNNLCLYCDVEKEKMYILASKGDISKKYINPEKHSIENLELFKIKELRNLMIPRNNIPANFSVVDESDNEYYLIDNNYMFNEEFLVDVNPQIWEVVIKNAAISNKLQQIKDIILKLRINDINEIKQKCKKSFNFNYINIRNEINDKIMKAYSENNITLQQEYLKHLNTVKDGARLEELEYYEFERNEINGVKTKWDQITNLLFNFINEKSRFNLGNFTNISNRAKRAGILEDNEIGEIYLAENCQINCVVHLDKGPAVIWLNKSNNLEDTTNDFCINFPLANHDKLKQTVVNNPVCGDCAPHYLKYSQVSVYRQAVTSYIPALWDDKNINYVSKVLYQTYTENKQLSHIKMLMLSLFDDFATYPGIDKDLIIKSMLENIISTDTLNQEGNKMSLMSVLDEVITNEFNILRQPFSATIRIIKFGYKYRKLNIDVVIKWIRLRFAYYFIEIYSRYIKKYSTIHFREQMDEIIFETFCGIPVENTAKCFAVNAPWLSTFIGDKCWLSSLDEISCIIGWKSSDIIHNEMILNIIWHLYSLENHQKPYALYINLMKNSQNFRNLENSEKIYNIVNNDKFNRYRKKDNPKILPYAFYNGEYSCPSKLFFRDQPLWSGNWNGRILRLSSIVSDLKLNLSQKMDEIYGSYYPSNSSSHFLLHRVVAQTLENNFKYQYKISDDMILDVLSSLNNTNGYHGNIYRSDLFVLVYKTIENFCVLRKNSTNYSTGISAVDKSYYHKVKSELLNCGMSIYIKYNHEYVEFDESKIIKQNLTAVSDISFDNSIITRIKSLYISRQL